MEESFSRLNRLRAGVLGANDGIVSTAGLIVGVAAATTSRPAILTAGSVGLFAGAVSMALGEYVSVSTQRDSERVLIAHGRMDSAVLVNPWQAAAASAVSFTCGAILPILAALTATSVRLAVVFAAVVVSLAITGVTASKLGDNPPLLPTLRTIAGGLLAMAITYGVGRIAGVSGI